MPSAWRAIKATQRTILGSWGRLASTGICCGATMGILSRAKVTTINKYPKFFSCPFFALVSWPFTFANTASHQLNMVPRKQSTTICIWDLVATCNATLSHSLVTVSAINLSSGRLKVLISICLSLGSAWSSQNSNQRLATDWPPILVPKRDNYSPLSNKPVKKYMSYSSISSQWPLSMKHWSCVFHLSTSHVKRSTWALMPGMAENLSSLHALNACNVGIWFIAVRSTSSWSLSHQISILNVLQCIKIHIRTSLFENFWAKMEKVKF